MYNNDKLETGFELEYQGQFGDLLYACGQVSYYFNMKDCLEHRVIKATNIAAAYNHDKRYYAEQLNEWKFKAERSLGVLKLKAKMAKIDFDISMFGGDKDWLNMLTISKDRRKAYKGYLKSKKMLTPVELEEKYQKLLKKRSKK